ncbi:MAG: hypothetical protein E7134_01810 [Rikenellaceae bacterium]|nr:hypothetical protein [Rikenellaceae bacterium]
MVRYLIVALMAALMIGCNAPEAEKPQEEKPVPEIDLSDYVEGQWRGVEIPEAIFSYDMKAIVDSIVTHEYVKVDDVAFVEKLTQQTLFCIDRYQLREWNTNWKQGLSWECVMMLDGDAPNVSILRCDGDGKFGVNHNFPDFPDGDCLAVEDYMHKEFNCNGWYTTHEWSYDAETNTLKTIVGPNIFEAKVLVFGGEYAILEGFVGTMPWMSTNQNEFELYLFKFVDESRDSFYEGYMSAQEYCDTWDAHCKELGIENVLFTMSFFNSFAY